VVLTERKTSGRYVYLATNGALRIVEALNPQIVSTTRLPGGAREMFVEGDRAVVYTSSARQGASLEVAVSSRGRCWS